MGRIKIGDIPEDQKISKEEMRKVFGGIIVQRSPSSRFFGSRFTKPVLPYSMEPGDDELGF